MERLDDFDNINNLIVKCCDTRDKYNPEGDLQKLQSLDEYIKLCEETRDTDFNYINKINQAMPEKMNKLKYIIKMNIKNCEVKSINNLPPNLIELCAAENKIEQINYLPFNLEYLDVNNNLIQVIKELPLSLKTLNLSRNKLTNESIQCIIRAVKIDLSYNYLNIIPNKINNSIKILNISNNQLDSLKIKFDFLEELDCSYNNIQNLGKLPLMLVKLNASYNKIKVINELPSTLQYINLSKNNINEFVLNLPKKIKELNLSDNNIGLFLVNNIKEIEIEQKIDLSNNANIFIDDDDKKFIISNEKNNPEEIYDDLTNLDNYFENENSDEFYSDNYEKSFDETLTWINNNNEEDPNNFKDYAFTNYSRKRDYDDMNSNDNLEFINTYKKGFPSVCDNGNDSQYQMVVHSDSNQNIINEDTRTNYSNGIHTNENNNVHETNNSNNNFYNTNINQYNMNISDRLYKYSKLNPNYIILTKVVIL